MGNTVSILPQTTGCLLCAEYRGKVAREDFEGFHQEIENVWNSLGRIRLLVVFHESFDGWEPEAAEANLMSISKFAPRVERLAYVNPPAQKVFQMKLSNPLFKGEVRFFNKDEFEEAYAWVGEP